MQKIRIISRALLFISLLTGAACNSLHAADSLTIMSYNIHNAIGMDGKCDYARIAAVITTAAPDVVALQELDSMTHRSHGVYALKEIAEHAGMHYFFCPAIPYDGGSYGIGILSRQEPLAVTRIPLPGREEARVLLVAEFAHYVLLATHFSLTPADEEASARIVAKAAAKYRKPVFLAGDLNAVPSSKAQRILRRHFTALTDTSWVTCEGTCIDYIYARTSRHAPYRVLHRRLIDDHMASDHCPVLVTLRLQRNGSPTVSPF
jgi:endonuclease/exonuclease/phosphatase family metal-dependent hydrolase